MLILLSDGEEPERLRWPRPHRLRRRCCCCARRLLLLRHAPMQMNPSAWLLPRLADWPRGGGAGRAGASGGAMRPPSCERSCGRADPLSEAAAAAEEAEAAEASLAPGGGVAAAAAAAALPFVFPRPAGLIITEPLRPEMRCSPGHFTCRSGSVQCIPSKWQCDGWPTCEDESDEIGCPNSCRRHRPRLRSATGVGFGSSDFHLDLNESVVFLDVPQNAISSSLIYCPESGRPLTDALLNACLALLQGFMQQAALEGFSCRK
ncbi:integral membrane protein DGCR2/IDD [Crotalus adamanteus]|uniref:Integral membrane protein DGCR2/IDD n=1 Tax=Crotalus adamanteus TaxID=8729 RepID=A0AAW1APA4_CROAD